MWVFGGVFPRPDPLPDNCSNELYVFNLFDENWYKPLVMGNKPAPRSGQVHHCDIYICVYIYIYIYIYIYLASSLLKTPKSRPAMRFGLYIT